MSASVVPFAPLPGYNEATSATILIPIASLVRKSEFRACEASCCRSSVGYTPAWTSSVYPSCFNCWKADLSFVVGKVGINSGVARGSPKSGCCSDVAVGVAPTERTSG